MDSIERMRRLNELTKELKQRGFAESSFEAIQQANQIYGDDELSDDVKHGMIKNAEHEHVKDANSDESNKVNIEKKMARLSESIDMLTGKTNEIIKAINDIDNRLNLLNHALKSRPERIIEKVVENKPVQLAEPPKAVESESSDDKPNDEYSVNQRVGNFQSKDVAIDKMFYYGKK